MSAYPENVRPIRPEPDEPWDDVEVYAEGDPTDHLNPGDHHITRCVGIETREMFDGRGRPSQRLRLMLELVQCQEAGTRLPLWLKLTTRPPGRPGRRRAPEAGRASAFVQAWTIAAGHPPGRRERLTTTVFRNRLFRVRIRRVEKDWQQQPHARPYCVVACILERLA